MMPESVIALCSRDSAPKMINDIMHLSFSAEYLATHSMTGAKSSRGGEQKEKMDQVILNKIIGKLEVPSCNR